ncbi:MAG: tetraacyldisaccharide 4'-kinase [Acidobacteria bacterium]|nr:tetraacyldisaccharide 4'-kinase [Acidobacteriota bacterium]
MRAPGFWSRDGLVPALLSPLSPLVTSVTARRVARPGWRAPVPVICCGNVTVGGSGKTTVALDLLARLSARGIAAYGLTRGYKGAASGVHRVSPDDPVSLVGDEALLLARVAPTWIGADRAAAARAAIAEGAAALVMDDGLQNPTLHKDVSLLVIDGGAGFGNGRVLPAGPLREPVAAGAARCTAAVLIGEDRTRAVPQLGGLPVLRARLVADETIHALAGRAVFAFAGIGRPEKFFTSLREAGAAVTGTRGFPDHHAYSERDIESVLRDAGTATAVTTPKDAVRLPLRLRGRVLTAGVTLAWDDPSAIEALLPQPVHGPES